jgi:hypothetical protein
MSDQREQRNAIFGNASNNPSVPAGIDPRMPMQSAADKLKAEFGLDIPTELVPLPSNGKVYPVGTSLHSTETVEIRPMTAREEDILTSRALLKKGTVITELIRSCLIDRSINANELLTGDRNALMVAIRITGYGPEYNTEIECNECNTKMEHSFDLSSLPIKRLEIEPVVTGSNLFEFALPYSKKVVKFRFLTGRDEEEIAVMNEKQKKLGLNAESNITTNLLHSIVSIEGIDDRSKIANFIKHMPARDSLALRNYIKNNEPGVVMRQETTCPSCSHSEEVSMPLGVNFLWPSAAR